MHVRRGRQRLLTVGRAFGDPCVSDNPTIIPAAAAAGMTGGDGRHNTKGEDGELDGSGLTPRSLGGAAFPGVIGAILGPGLGTAIRRLGGAVAAAILILFVLPPLAVQVFTVATPRIPPTLFAVISGVSTKVSLGAALPAPWEVLPAASVLPAFNRRSVL